MTVFSYYTGIVFFCACVCSIVTNDIFLSGASFKIRNYLYFWYSRGTDTLYSTSMVFKISLFASLLLKSASEEETEFLFHLPLNPSHPTTTIITTTAQHNPGGTPNGTNTYPVTLIFNYFNIYLI